jgi:hypothetical protein
MSGDVIEGMGSALVILWVEARYAANQIIQTKVSVVSSCTEKILV